MHYRQRWLTTCVRSDSTVVLAVANRDSNHVSVLLGNGDGSFQAARSFTAGSLPTSVAVGDFDGDGPLDLAVPGAGGVRVLLGNGDGTFHTTSPQRTVEPFQPGTAGSPV